MAIPRLPWLRSGLIVAGAAGLTAATMMLYGPAPPELPTAEVERRDFLRTVTTRGELKSAMSVQIVAPQTPDLKIVQLAENGRPITEGAIIVQFDESAQEDLLIERETEVRQVDSEIEQAEAQHAITDERNEMMVMQATYNLERAELEASKQEILAEIEAEKAKIDVVIAKGELTKSETNAEASDMSQAADMERLMERKSKAIRDLDLSKTYLGSMLLRAPRDGIVHILPNNRAQGSFGTARPPFQEGDTVWTGAAIAEIPDLESLRVEFRVDEVDRGRVEEGQETRIRIDAVPDALLSGAVSWLSPIATLVFNRLPPEKNFPAHSGIDDIDDRLRPGMSATVEIVVQRISDVLVIPNKASTQIDGKPTVFVKDGPGFQRRPIEVSATNGTEIVVASGLEEGDVIALENPELADQGRTL
ncbi:MAG: HlyD family efflux transporter periplasmic adaptor subunit [Bryobacterales bacterium]|nr:HlyD family efflux transporter periplasmic adaptor subunit [Bryobacterales bacterium]